MMTDTFEVDGITYSIEKSGRENLITISGEVAFATKKVFSAATSDAQLGFEFQQACTGCPGNMASASFECDGVKYEMSTLEGETCYRDHQRRRGLCNSFRSSGIPAGKRCIPFPFF